MALKSASSAAPPRGQLENPAGYANYYPQYDPSLPDSSFNRKLMELDAQIQDAQRARRDPLADPFCPRWFVACDPFPSLWRFPSAAPRAPIAPASHPQPQERDFSPFVREYEPPSASRPPPPPVPEPTVSQQPAETADATLGSRKPSKRRKGNRSSHRG
jgi:hypothetical protein